MDADLPVILPEAALRLDAAQAVAALGRVDEVYRAPVALFYLEDCSYQEIADILEVPMALSNPDGARIGATQTHFRRVRAGPQQTGRPP